MTTAHLVSAIEHHSQRKYCGIPFRSVVFNLFRKIAPYRHFAWKSPPFL